MTTTLGFTITFYGPFRVGAAYGQDGVDASVDHDDPLPADHLKGVMRFAAVTLLGPDNPVLKEVFGSHRAPSPWSWTSASPSDDSRWTFAHRNRVAIDPDTHAARKEQLALGEQAFVPEARFEVLRTGYLPAAREEQHRLVLRCAAAGVHGLGAWRRRGLGWVGIVPADGEVTEEEAGALLALRQAPGTATEAGPR